MPNYNIVTDSCCDLRPETYEQLNLTVVPLSMEFRGQVREDKSDDSIKEVYAALRAGESAQTAAVNPDRWLNAMEPHLAEGRDVLVMAFSSGLSTTYQSAVIAAEELREKYPHAKIMTIDTYAASLGEGLQVLEAAELLRAGRSFEEVGDRILARRPHMCQFFTVDDLNYLKRGGRISGAAALVGSVLGIKPILRGDETGHIVSCGKVRGNKKAYAELADYFDKRALDKTARIGIAHADNREGTDYLLGLLRERGFTGECLEVYYEPVTGAHVGPGTVALFFYGTEK